MGPGFLALSVVVVAVVCCSGAVSAADWATGPALARRLAAPVDVFWPENPLRGALRGLSKAQQVAIVIDRRVDPQQQLNIKLAGVPLGEALGQIAHSRHLEVAWLGAVAYIGPPTAATRLTTLARLRKEDAARQKKLLQARSFAWNDFATPAELLERLAAEAGMSLADSERVPHDLWAGADLPPLALVDRLTLILNQFDLTFEVDGQQGVLRLTPVPGDLHLDTPKVVSRPAIKTAKTPARENLLAKRYTLNVAEKPVGRLLKELTRQMNLEIEFDDEAIRKAGLSLETRVSFSVKEVTVDELLDSAAKPVGLAARRRGSKVLVTPR